MTRTALLLALMPAVACAPAAMGEPAPGAPPAPTRLAAVIDSVISSPALARSYWGIEVVEAGSGRSVYRLNADRLFTPASNLKLATTAAALDLLGPDYRYETRLRAVDVRHGVAASLVVHGSGDPTFSAPFLDDPLAPLDSMADSLVAAGVRRIDGPIVIDQSRFDSTLVHPAWEAFDLDWYYAAPIAPFAIMRGAIPVVMWPGAVGAPASVEVLLPDGLVAVHADVRTVDGGRGWNDQLRRPAHADSLVLLGTIGVEAGPDTSWIAQTDPGRLAGAALRQALQRAGIEATGPVTVRYTPAPAGDGGADLVVTWRSAPLRQMLGPPLASSDNWVTEQLLKTVGAEAHGTGSWSNGTARVEQYLTDRVGVAAGAVWMRDGSGLTQQNLVTPGALVAILRHASRQPWGPDFHAALVRPGDPTGTLRDRLTGHAGRVAAKTGTIRHVNGLSGYAYGAGASTLVFSIINNASGRPAPEVRRAVDRIIEAILESGS